MIEGHGLGDRIANFVIYSVLIAVTACCFAPFIYVVARSFSSYDAVLENRVFLWPVGFNLDNYIFLVRADRLFLRTFATSLARVLTGVVLNLAVAVLTAYPLSRDRLHIPGRSVFKFYMLFSMLFSGGLIPTFLAYKSLGLIDKFAVYIVPGALNVFYAIIVANYFRGLPMELSESALLDGANHFDVLLRIFLPLSLPVLATIAVFSAVGHWNSWFDGMIFMSRNTKWPMQSYLYSRITQRRILAGNPDPTFPEMTPEAVAAAMIVVAALPIMLVYPFAQKYFITGLTLGAVKG